MSEGVDLWVWNEGSWLDTLLLGTRSVVEVCVEWCCHWCQHLLMNALKICLDCINLEAPLEGWLETLVALNLLRFWQMKLSEFDLKFIILWFFLSRRLRWYVARHERPLGLRDMLVWRQSTQLVGKNPKGRWCGTLHWTTYYLRHEIRIS